jgi:diguanylate cyclase (GGDEF)-like protein/PAS domain S-box-containing protein
MDKNKFDQGKDLDLRKKAEKILFQNASKQLNNLADMTVKEILHELEVHQIELELQNEELRLAQGELEKVRARYYDLYDLAPVSYCTLSAEGIILNANLAAANLLGETRYSLVEKPFFRYILPEDQDEYYFFRKRMLLANESQECELRMKTTDQSQFWALLQAIFAPDISKEGGVRLVLTDITERKKIEQALEQQEKRQELAVDLASSFLNKSFKSMEATVDKVLAKIARNLYVDRAYIFTFSPEKEIMKCLYSWTAGDGEEKVIKKNKSYILTKWLSKKITSRETVLISNLDNLPVEATATRKKFSEMSIKSLLWQPMFVDGELLAMIGIDTIYKEKNWEDNHILTMDLISNITASALKRDRAEQDLLFQTFHDQLTGLYNRTFFQEEIKRLNVERQLPISLIIADINNLKLVNDIFGHDKGDELIKKVAEIFKDVCREEDVITRWGGDEFIILLPQSGIEIAKEVCARIKNKMHETNEISLPVSVALGYSVKENLEDDFYEIIKIADDRMYKNKFFFSRDYSDRFIQTLLNELSKRSHEGENIFLACTS